MKKKFSFFETFQLKYILGFCLILVAIDTSKLVRSVFIKQSEVNNYGNFLLYFIMGFILILMGITSVKYREEKIAILAFGAGLILNSVGKFISYQLSLVFIILLELFGAYCFWLTNKIHILKSKTEINKNKLFLVLLVLLIPPFLIWLFGITWK